MQGTLAPGFSTQSLGSSTIAFYLRGEEGAVHFNMLTGAHAMGVDLGYHALRPRYTDQRMMECGMIADFCYYDSSGLAADSVFADFLAADGGESAIRDRLKEYYMQVFFDH